MKNGINSEKNSTFSTSWIFYGHFSRNQLNSNLRGNIFNSVKNYGGNSEFHITILAEIQKQKGKLTAINLQSKNLWKDFFNLEKRNNSI